MKKKPPIGLTIILVIAMVVWGGLLQVATYLVDQYYAKLAPQQVDDDSAYTIMHTSGPVHNIIWIVGIGVFILLIWFIIRGWVKYVKSKRPQSM